MNRAPVAMIARCRGHGLLPVAGQALLRAVPVAAGPTPSHALPVAVARGYASKDGPSLSDLAKGAGYLIGNVVDKAKNALSNVLSSVLPDRKAEQERMRSQGPTPADIGRQLFGGGLLGRVMGGVLSSAIRSAAAQMEQAAEAAAALQEQAARVVEGSTELRNKVGSRVKILPPISQFSGLTNINGAVRQRTALVMPVADERGRIVGEATAEQIQGADSKGNAPKLDVTVVLNDGRTVELDSSAPSGQTIDVEWRRVD